MFISKYERYLFYQHLIKCFIIAIQVTFHDREEGMLNNCQSFFYL